MANDKVVTEMELSGFDGLTTDYNGRPIAFKKMEEVSGRIKD